MKFNANDAAAFGPISGCVIQDQKLLLFDDAESLRRYVMEQNDSGSAFEWGFADTLIWYPAEISRAGFPVLAVRVGHAVKVFCDGDQFREWSASEPAWKSASWVNKIVMPKNEELQ